MCTSVTPPANSKHALDGARERLKRADQHIRDLELRLDTFLSKFRVIKFEGENPVFSDDDRIAFEVLKNLGTESVPPEFKVICGEIVHHMRCAFDHLAWQLSSVSSREDTKIASKIDFPIFDQEPRHSRCHSHPKKLCGYCRKVQGITSVSSLAKIDGLQPYKRGAPHGHPLWIIHDLDRTDKHRELVINLFAIHTRVSAELRAMAVLKQSAHELRPRFVGTRDLEMHVRGQISAQVAFEDIPEREDKSVVPTLKDLFSFASDTIESFATEFDGDKLLKC